MGEARKLVDAADEAPAPLTQARNSAWWESSVVASDENTRRQADTELAYSGFLADAELFARVNAALTNGAEPETRRRIELLWNEMLPHQVPEALRAEIVELEASVGSRYSRHRGVVRGAEVDDNTIKQILRESDDPDERGKVPRTVFYSSLEDWLERGMGVDRAEYLAGEG